MMNTKAVTYAKFICHQLHTWMIGKQQPQAQAQTQPHINVHVHTRIHCIRKRQNRNRDRNNKEKFNGTLLNNRNKNE